jgi:hypothetical protein
MRIEKQINSFLNTFFPILSLLFCFEVSTKHIFDDQTEK